MMYYVFIDDNYILQKVEKEYIGTDNIGKIISLMNDEKKEELSKIVETVIIASKGNEKWAFPIKQTLKVVIKDDFEKIEASSEKSLVIYRDFVYETIGEEEDHYYILLQKGKKRMAVGVSRANEVKEMLCKKEFENWKVQKPQRLYFKF